MTGQLVNKVAIVTGAAHGIGKAIARRLASDGAMVIVTYFDDNPDEAEQVVASLKKANGKALAVKADVSDPAQVEMLFDSAQNAFGTVSLLVNNARREVK